MGHGLIEMHVKNFSGNRIYLDKISVGATISIMLAAIRINGRTTIRNCAREPEIVDLANFLNNMGARVRGAGKDVIKIDRVKNLHGTKYRIIPDCIEAGTYMLAAAATRGQVLIKNVIPRRLSPVIAKLREADVIVNAGEDSIFVDGPQDFKSVDVNTQPYPGFPTDLQPFTAVLLTQSKGSGIITENIFADRFLYLDEFKRLGARIKLSEKSAIISGVSPLSACSLQAIDMRGGAACIIAGLMVTGITEFKGIHHIERGYDEIEDKLRHLGAHLVRVNDTTRKCYAVEGDELAGPCFKQMLALKEDDAK
jgi:UDP-N-acetylglucosamine 1-carboxyvinyltransferase